MSVDISPFEDAFVPFTVRRLKRATVLWSNPSTVSELTEGPAEPLGIKVCDRFAYAIPDRAHFPDVMFDLDDERQFLAERYGGSGLVCNGGGGRSGIVDGVQIKGIGRNPLVGQSDDEWHTYGGLNLVDAVLEAINSEVFNHILPHGAVRSHAIVLTGKDTAFMPSGRHNRGPGALLVREFCTRPGHFLRAGTFRVREEHKAQLLDDVERTRRMNIQLCSALGGHLKVVEHVGEFLSKCAEQFAFARLFRIYHGALSASNISFDGRWLDLTNIGFVPTGLNISGSDIVTPFYGEMSAIMAYVDEFLYTYTKYHCTEFDIGPLVAFFYEQVESSLLFYGTCVFGFSSAGTDHLSGLSSYRALINDVKQRLESNRKTVIASAVGDGSTDAMTAYLEDLFSSLGSEAEPSPLQRAFRDVIAESFKRVGGAQSYSTFARLAAVESLKRSHFCHLFSRSRLLVRLLRITDCGDFASLQSYVDEHIAASQWMFSKVDGDIAILFQSRGLEVSIRRDSGRYQCSTSADSALNFETSTSLSAWVDDQETGTFCIDDMDFKSGLQRILRVLSIIEACRITSISNEGSPIHGSRTP